MERSPIQGNTGPEDPAGASSGSEVAAPEPQDFEVRGSRFSKSADERQRMLMQRKEELLLRARRCASLFPVSYGLHCFAPVCMKLLSCLFAISDIHIRFLRFDQLIMKQLCYLLFIQHDKMNEL